MTDEVLTPETDEATEEVTTEPVVEAPSPDAEFKAREEAIAKRERELQRGFDEVARREREAASRTAPPVEEDDIPEIPEDTAKALDKFFTEKYGTKLRAVDNLYADVVENELAKRENPDAIKDAITEYGLMPKDDSISAIREVFDKAETIAKAKSSNPDAEREAIRAEERKKLLEELAAEGVHVETIEPKRSETSPEVSLDDDDLDSNTKVRLLQEKWGKNFSA